MTEHYISFEQAAILKKLEFEGNGLKNYIRQGYYKFPNGYISPIKHDGDGILVQFRKEDAERIPAPRLDQAQAWLREVKGIHIAVDPYCKENNSDTNICNAEDCFWSMELSSVPFGYWLNVSKGEFDTYELALSDGISGALDLLTNRLNEK